MNGNQQRWFGYASQWFGIALLCSALNAGLHAWVAYGIAISAVGACWRAGR